MGLFDNRIAYKPFEYPEYYTEGWLKQAQAFWLHTEIPMSGDVKDWNEKLTPSEKNLVGNILLGFSLIKLIFRSNLLHRLTLVSLYVTKMPELALTIPLYNIQGIQMVCKVFFL